METSQDVGHVWECCFLWTLSIMKSCLEGFRDNCKCHWGEWGECRLCTASFTHCCFPDSPASLCHLRLLFLHLQKSTLLLPLVFPHQSHLLLLMCPGANARLWLCSFSAEGEPEITGGQHEVGTREWWPCPWTRNQQNCPAEWLGSGKFVIRWVEIRLWQPPPGPGPSCLTTGPLGIPLSLTLS